MTTDNYILLLANTYLENGEKIGYGLETVNIRKELFQQKLTRVQRIEERDNFITKKEFLSQCLIALNLLKEFVDIEGYIHLNYLKDYLKDIEDGKYENEYFSPDNIPVNWEAEKKRIKYELDNFDIDEYLAPTSKLITGIYKKLCNKDIAFIEDIFNNFRFETVKPQETEPLDLLDNITRIHGVSENPFVIDLIKNYFDLRLESQMFNIDLKDSFNMFLIRKQKLLKQTDFISKNEFYSKIEAYVTSLGHSILNIQNELENLENFKDNAGISLESFWKHKGKFKLEVLKMEDVNLILNIVAELLLKSNPKPQPQQIQKPTKSIFDFINNVKDKNEFLIELKKTFPTEKGKSIKIIIKLLEKEDFLIFNNREFKLFYNELKTFLNRDIGTRQSINDVIFEDIHFAIIEPIQKKLNPLILKHKTK